MSAEAEFLLVALTLYLWASGLWLPPACVALRRVRRGRWKASSPERFIQLRELGLVPMLPFPPDLGLAPCQPPPLIVDAYGNIGVADGAEDFRMIGNIGWDDFGIDGKHLLVKGHKVRLASPRWRWWLSRAKARGLTPADAVRSLWHRALSPARAEREWRRWRRVSAPLAWLCPMITAAFFIGLPWAYLTMGSQAAVAVVLIVWSLMISVSIQLLRLGKRVYPGARSVFRADALLAAIVPFHAMRALENAAVHAMAGVHPAALIRASGDRRNPWLPGFIRRMRHPRPGSAGDAALSRLVLPLLGNLPGDDTLPPEHGNDAQAGRWCPRCHESYVRVVETCPDCRHLPLRDFPAAE